MTAVFGENFAKKAPQASRRVVSRHPARDTKAGDEVPEMLPHGPPIRDANMATLLSLTTRVSLHTARPVAKSPIVLSQDV